MEIREMEKTIKNEKWTFPPEFFAIVSLHFSLLKSSINLSAIISYLDLISDTSSYNHSMYDSRVKLRSSSVL